MLEKTCGVCKHKIILEHNQFGLVFEDKFFVCEDCRNTISDEELTNLTKTIMQHPENGMPIALWLIHEQNKDKPIFSRKIS